MYKKQQSTIDAINAQIFHNQFDFLLDAIRNQNIKSHNSRNMYASISLLCQLGNKSNKLYKLFQLTMVITFNNSYDTQEFCSKNLFISVTKIYAYINKWWIGEGTMLSDQKCPREAESDASPLDLSEQHWTGSWNHSVQPLAVAVLAASLCFALCRPICAGPITMWPQFGCEQW